ncbi:MAG: riboflavin synthase [Candidatus Bipolaricaulota bacterium]
MFTGIVQATSSVMRVSPGALEVAIPSALRGALRVGGSIAVDGVCLTVRHLGERSFVADVSSETARRTALAHRPVGTGVNLELPVPAGGGLDGHWVLGHVDAVGRLRALVRERSGWTLVVSFPPPDGRYVVDKGSVTVDGVSLTPFGVTAGEFRCAVIPETYEKTTLRERRPGDPVNLEYDVLAKYVERMMRDVSAD